MGTYEAFIEAVHPDDRQKVIDTVNISLEGNFDYHIEHRIIRPNGEERIVFERGEVTYDENGIPIQMFGTVQDITERKQDEKRIQDQLKNLTSLHQIDTAITNSFDLTFILNTILDKVIDRLDVDAAIVLILNENTQKLDHAASRGFYDSALVKTVSGNISKRYTDRPLLERGLVHLNEIDLSRVHPPFLQLLQQEDFAAYYSVPLMIKGSIKGMLEIYNRKALSPSEEWLSFLSALEKQTSIAIENATLFENVQRSNANLNLAYDTTLEGWAKALDLRDRETEGHSRRVTEMTLKMAVAMGIDGEELTHIRRGALLHDIGKMGIPDSILLKEGSLTDEEWEIMKQHPQYAFDLLSPINYLGLAMDIPYAHHEKWDGSGYPHGLQGQDIPLAARIFAIADVWDALNSDRPYRPAWEPNLILEYIQEQTNKHFDPYCVKIFLDVFDAE